MRRSNLIAATAAACVGLLVGVSVRQPGARAAESSVTDGAQYQYVGVDSTLARVHNLTGEVDLLQLEQGSTASLVHYYKSGRWVWRPVRLERERGGSTAARPGAAGDGSERESRRP